MPRGKASDDGATRVAANGYHYTKVDGNWRLQHHLVAEAKLGRSLLENETVRFVDGDRENFEPDNIQVLVKKTTSIRRRLAIIESKMADLQAEKEQLLKELENES